MAVADVNDQNPAFQLNDYFAEVHENLTFVCPLPKSFKKLHVRNIISYFRIPL